MEAGRDRVAARPYRGGGTPFGWIWWRAGSEKCANMRFWMADRLPDGLDYDGMKGRAVLGVPTAV